MNVGDIVKGTSGRRFRVQGYLDEGVTSVVYQAQDVESEEVAALKVLRTNLSEGLTNNFWREGQILGEFARAEQRVGDGYHNIPRVLDIQRQTTPKWIALQFAPGISLDKLLGGGKALPEPIGLQVIEQVLRVIDLLHSQLRRTYTDFQLKNIFVEQHDDKPPIVMILDWNTTSDPWPLDDPLPTSYGGDDLARCGAYLYRILTGMGADERGEPRRRLENRAGEQWQALSLGTQELLGSVLHPTPLRRLASAREFRREVQKLSAMWRADWLTLLGDVKEAVNASPLSDASLQNALVLLDMAERRGASREQTTFYRRKLEPFLNNESVSWAAGQRYFTAGQYRSAAEKWRGEAETEGLAALWRWVTVAEAGVALGPTVMEEVKQSLIETITALNEGDAESAAKCYGTLPQSQIACLETEILRNDIQLHLATQDAQIAEGHDTNEGKERAAQSYRLAAAALDKLPYRDTIAEERGWADLADRAIFLERQIREDKETTRFLTDIAALLRSDPAEGRRVLEIQLRLNASHRGLVQLCLDESNDTQAQGDVQGAIALIDLLLLYAQVPDVRTKAIETWKLLQKQLEHKQASERVPILASQKSLDLERLEQRFEQTRQARISQYEQKLRELDERFLSERKARKEQYAAELEELRSKAHLHLEALQQHLLAEQEKMQSMLADKMKEFQNEQQQLSAQLHRALLHERKKVALRVARQRDLLRQEQAEIINQMRQQLLAEREQAVAEQVEEERLIREQQQRILVTMQQRFFSEREKRLLAYNDELNNLQLEYEKRRKQQIDSFQRAFARLKEQFEEAKAREVAKNHQLLEVFTSDQAARLEQWKHDHAVRDHLERAELLLEERQWQAALEVVSTLARKETITLTEQYLHSLQKYYVSALRQHNLPMARSLLTLLELLSPEPQLAVYRNEFNQLREKIEHLDTQWARHIQRTLLLKIESENFERRSLLRSIERLLALADPDFPELRAWLEAIHTSLTIEAESDASGSATPAIPLSQEGFVARLLTRLLQFLPWRGQA